MGKLLMLFCMLTVFAAAGIGAEAELADVKLAPDQHQELFGYPEGPVRDWPDDQQLRLAEEAFALFSPILQAVKFTEDDAESRLRWFGNVNERLREMRNIADEYEVSRRAFIARYFPQEIAERYADSKAPGADYWKRIDDVLQHLWGDEYRLLFDPERGRLEFEAGGGEWRFETDLELPPLALRAIADVLRPCILTGLPETHQDIPFRDVGFGGRIVRHTLGDGEWAPVEVFYEEYDEPKPREPFISEDYLAKVEAERQRIRQLPEPALPIAWHDDWEHAFETANAENRPVMVFFECRGSDAESLKDITFRDPDIAELAERTVNLRFHRERDAALYTKHKVPGMSTIRFYSPHEELLAELRAFTLPADLADAQRKVLSGDLSLQLLKDRFAANLNDPSIAADLLKYFSHFIEPDETLKALDAVCAAIRNRDESIIERYERTGPCLLFLQRVRTLFKMYRWRDALEAAESDVQYLEKEWRQASMCQIKVLCLYVLGRSEEAHISLAELVQAYGARENPFDRDRSYIWFQLDREFTDWP